MRELQVLVERTDGGIDEYRQENLTQPTVTSNGVLCIRARDYEDSIENIGQYADGAWLAWDIYDCGEAE